MNTSDIGLCKVGIFELSKIKKFNMLINNNMYYKLEEKFGKKNVRRIITKIVKYSISSLKSVTKDIDDWILYQHLLEKNQLTEEKQLRKNNVNEKQRKYIHHFVLIHIDRQEYNWLKEFHFNMNTFSIAMVIRLMVEIFLLLFEKYGDENLALSQMKKGILKINQKKVRYNLNFAFYYEKSSSQKDNIVVFFEFAYFSEKGNLIISSSIRL